MDPAQGCDAGRFRAASLANLVLIEMAALLNFVPARGLTGSDRVALAAAGGILLDVSLLRSHRFHRTRGGMSRQASASRVPALPRTRRSA